MVATFANIDAIHTQQKHYGNLAEFRSHNTTVVPEKLSRNKQMVRGSTTDVITGYIHILQLHTYSRPCV